MAADENVALQVLLRKKRLDSEQKNCVMGMKRDPSEACVSFKMFETACNQNDKALGSFLHCWEQRAKQLFR